MTLTPTDLEAALDVLYAASLHAFVTERKRLATELRKAGDRAGSTALGKATRPSMSAWVVNQLWRRERAHFEALFGAAARIRAGELSAGADQRAALARLRTLSADLLRSEDHAASESTLTRVATTLQALAASGSFEPDAPGRLVADRDPPGFEAMAALARPAPAAADGGRSNLRDAIDAGGLRITPVATAQSSDHARGLPPKPTPQPEGSPTPTARGDGAPSKAAHRDAGHAKTARDRAAGVEGARAEAARAEAAHTAVGHAEAARAERARAEAVRAEAARAEAADAEAARAEAAQAEAARERVRNQERLLRQTVLDGALRAAEQARALLAHRELAARDLRTALARAQQAVSEAQAQVEASEKAAGIAQARLLELG